MGKSAGVSKGGKRKQNEVKEEESKIVRQQDIPDNEVNRGEEVVKIEMGTKKSTIKVTPAKKRKSTKESKITASFPEEDEFVSITVKGHDDFDMEEGEITEMSNQNIAVKNQEALETRENLTAEVMQPQTGNLNAGQGATTGPSGSQDQTEPNFNESANITELLTAEFAATMEMRKRNEKEKEEAEMSQVTKRIAGEIFALVRDMMQESGLFEMASIMKDQSSKAAKQKKKSRDKGETSILNHSASETTIYDNAIQRKMDHNNLSSSSDEPMDTSDEVDGNNIVSHFINTSFPVTAESVEKKGERQISQHVDPSSQLRDENSMRSAMAQHEDAQR